MPFCDIWEFSLKTFRARCKVCIRRERNHKNKKKNLCNARAQKKKKSVLFFTPWLPGKSDLGKVLKWRKLKRALKLCKIVFTLFSLIHTYTHVVLFFNDMYFWLLNFCFIEGH